MRDDRGGVPGTVRIVLHGRLRREFGTEFRLGVTSPAAAIYALSKMVPGFRAAIAAGQYRVRRGSYRSGTDLSLSGLALRVAEGGEMHLIPVAAGAKGGGTGKIIIGAVILIAAIVLMQPEFALFAGIGETAATGMVGAGVEFTTVVGLSTPLIGGLTIGNLGLAGAALIVTGAMMLLSPQPRASNYTATSFLLSGLGNTAQQGVPIPVPYGRCMVGSVVISGGYAADDFFPPSYLAAVGETFPAPLTGGSTPAGTATLMAGQTGQIDTGRGGGKSGGGSGGGSVADDTLFSKAVVRIIDVLGEGPIGGLVDGAKSIYFNNTPLQASDGSYNFRGVIWEMRYGNPDQDPVSGYPASESSVSIGLQVKQATPVTQTISGSSMTAARVTMQFPAMYHRDTSNGNVHVAPALHYTIDILPSGPGWTGAWSRVADVNIFNGKCSSPYQKSHRFDLPRSNGADTWNIRVTRITADSTDTTNLQYDSYWLYLDTIDDHQIMYANTAYIAYTFDARLFGSTSLPTRRVEIWGRTISLPRNYNPATHSYSMSGPGTSGGTWDLVSTYQRPSGNPAWILLDMLSHPRYGCGISGAALQTTKAELYNIAQYCDGMVDDGYGGREPRYEINATIHSSDDAYRVLQLITATFRGSSYWGGGQVLVSADMPSDPIKLANQANVGSDGFSYEGTSLSNEHNVVNVAYLDKNNRYLPAIEPVYDTLDIAKRGARPTDLMAWGCTSRSLAHRLGKWALWTERNQTETVKYDGGAYHLDSRPGDVVYVSDPAYAGIRMAGRIKPRTVSPGTNLIGDSVAPALVAPAPNNVSPSTSVPALYVGVTVNALSLGLGGGTDCGALSLSVPQGTTFVTAWVWVPTGFAGTDVRLTCSATTNSIPPALQIVAASPLTYVADLTLRDQWQRIGLIAVTVGPNTLRIGLAVTAPGADLVYATAFMADPTGLFPFVATLGGVVKIQQVYLDALFQPDSSSSFTLSVVMPDGTIDTGVGIDSFNSAGTSPDYSLLKLHRPLAKVPTPNAEWLITSTNVAPRQFRIVGNTEPSRRAALVTGLIHHPEKYAEIEAGIGFDPQSYSVLPALLTTPLAIPTNVTVMDYMVGTGVTQVIRVAVSWTAPRDPRITAFEVRGLASTNATNWNAGWAVTFHIDTLNAGDVYIFMVRSLGADGKMSDWSTAATPVTVDGKVEAPIAPTGLTVTGGTRRVQIVWTPIPNRRDILQYEVWRNNSSSGPGSGASLLAVSGGTSYLDAQSDVLVPNTTWYYWVRAIAIATPTVAGGFAGPANGTTTLLIAADLADAIISTAKFAAGIKPVRLIADLTATGIAGDIAQNMANGILYRLVSGVWTPVVNAADMTGALTSAQIASVAAATVTGQIVGTQIAAGAISTASLAAGSVTTAVLAAGAVTASTIAANTIKAGNLAAGSVTTAALAAGAVTASTIAANTITAVNLAAGSVTTAALAVGAVTASTIAANSITAGQIQAGAISATELAAGSITTTKLATTFQLTNTAQIGTAVIQTANIANLTVQTSNIADAAISGIYEGTGYQSNVSVGITAVGFPVIIWGVLTTSLLYGYNHLYIYRDGVLIFEYLISPDQNFVLAVPVAFIDSPSPGYHTYQLKSGPFYTYNGGVTTLIALVLKK
jgi:predicted phage tail protein